VKISKIIIIGLFVGLLSSGLPNFITQDAYAVTGFTAETTSTTEITITYDVANMDAASIVDSDFEITLDDGTVITDADFNIAFSDGTGAGGNDQSVITLTANTMPTDDTPDVELLAGESVTSNGGLTTLNGAVNAEATDGISPTFTAERTAVDTITLTFSENVDADSTNENSAWTVSGGTVTATSDPADSDSMTITFSGITDTSSTPTVTYVAANGTVDDGVTGNEVANGGNAVATDGISPTVVSAQTTSSTTIDVTFSEDIVDTASDLDDYTINGVAGGSNISAISVSGAILTLTTNGYSILYGETVTVSFDGEADELEDTGTLNDVADFTNQAVTNNVSYVANGDCYDCIPPTLQESHITILNNHYVVATGDEPISITASVGDEISIVLKITDNISVQSIPSAALYTNFEQKPSDMNLFYTNNFDNLKQTSTSFYEWNVRSDDVAYDYDGTISWSDNAPTVVTDVITEDNFKFKNKDQNTLEYFMMPFTFTMNQPMDTTSIVAKIYDSSGNRLQVTLPVTLEIIPQKTVVLSDTEEIATLDKGEILVTPSEDTTPLLNEPVLLTVLSQWSGYSQTTSDDAEVLSSLGLQGESLPAWTKNLGEWVIQEKLDVSELITAIQYVNNQF